MARSNRHLSLPLIGSMELQSFSLYQLRDTVDVQFANGVTSLVGANGIGKSTFLAALAYALTGTVPPPNPRFNSIAAYHSLAASYAVRFFEGRVIEKDRDAATVRLRFQVDDYGYDLTRPIFAPDEIVALTVVGPSGQDIIRRKDRHSTDALRRRYEELLTQHTGLANFSQFVFLNHFLLAFDERRHLLFFDQDVAEKIFYLAFGVDPSQAELADELRKAADASDSLMRNFQYDATVARKQLEALRMAASTDEIEAPSVAILAQYQQLRAERIRSEESLASLLDELGGSRLSLAESAARLHQTEAAYTDVFARRVRRQSSVTDMPLIRTALDESICGVCGTVGEEVVQHINSAIDGHHCPLCASNLPEEPITLAPATALVEADQQLTQARHLYDAAQSRVERLTAETTESRLKLAELEERLRDLEASSPELSAALDAAASATVDAVESRLRGNIYTAEQRKEAERTKRDQALAELRPLQQKLMATFAEAQIDFVPRFREAAEEFIGLPLDISLASAGSAKVRLVLTVQGQRRSAAAQLSESQRYFLDVALRMALAEQLSAGNPIALYIDTPEGALDIAYEARVGSMFANFVKGGNRLVMTANVNSSQLLLRMADKCGPELMRIVRMTEWTPLSDVQVAEQDLFDHALDEIESRLEAAGRDRTPTSNPVATKRPTTRATAPGGSR